MGVTAQQAIAGAVGLAGGFVLAFAGWSSLSIGNRSMFVTTQMVASFGLYVAATPERSRTNVTFFVVGDLCLHLSP